VWRAAELVGIPESAADTVESNDLLTLAPPPLARGLL
jgi:hypothetical protein